MKKPIILGSVVFAFFAYFASFVGNTWAGDATLTLDDNAGSSSFVVQDSDKTNQFKVNSDGQGYFAGNVGIGVTSPLSTLNVYSANPVRLLLSTSTITNTEYADFFFKNSNTSDLGGMRIQRQTSGNSDTMLFSSTAGQAAVEVLRVAGNGNVGIGTTSPARKLHVVGSGSSGATLAELRIESSNFDNEAITFYANRSSTAERNFALWTNGGDFHLSSSKVAGGDPYNISKVNMTWNDAGNVGIGTTSPSEKLEVSGNIKASGTVSQGSSKDFKKNISSVSTRDAMKALNKLNPVRFEYKTDNSGEKHLGFIAEDVPDLVAEEDRKHLNSMDITAVLTKVVQEQQRQIEQLRNEISELKKLENANGI